MLSRCCVVPKVCDMVEHSHVARVTRYLTSLSCEPLYVLSKCWVFDNLFIDTCSQLISVYDGYIR